VIIIYEIAVIGLLVSFVVFCARPLFEAHADRIRSQADTDSKKNSLNHKLETKIAFLEAEVLDLRQQLKGLQESNEFALSLADNGKIASRPE
jgi:hypothetical protein